MIQHLNGFNVFITFNCFALLNNKEIRDIKWWLGYLMCCINYLFTYYIGRQLTIPVSNKFIWLQ